MNEKARAEMIEDASAALLDALSDYPTEIWISALGDAVASAFRAMRDAREIAEEEKAKRRLE